VAIDANPRSGRCGAGNSTLNKTNALRLLDFQQVHYEAKIYDDSGSFHSAEEAARLLGAPVGEVYKTLVVMRETLRSKPLLVMIAANREIDLRRLASSLGEKKLKMASLREAESLTGLQVGGISALALINRGFEICIDRPALALDQIHISGGARGLDVKLNSQDLIRVTHARVIDAGP
jgi:Cys-tRNA(Pro)/Cys-tRNA(Cys) deacylase